jgi:hypothetical protein
MPKGSIRKLSLPCNNNNLFSQQNESSIMIESPYK